MAEKKNHHYVPQSYQRLFSNEGKSIGIYNIKKNITFNQSSIKNRTARDFINDRLLVNAKEYLNDDLLTVNQISTKLGFEYPQHFVRFFKQHTRKTPSEYRNTV